MPARAFLYTLDQIAAMLAYTKGSLKTHVIFFEGSTGRMPPTRMRAKNIARMGDIPEWRVTEDEFRRWMKLKGFKLGKDRIFR